MRKFAGAKTEQTIIAQCVAGGLTCDTRRSDNNMGEYIAVSSPDAPTAVVYYSEVGRRFFGKTDQDVYFKSEDSLDGEPWFDSLLDFFFIPMPGAGDEGKPSEIPLRWLMPTSTAGEAL